jgi:hypothetical protein
MAHLGVVVFLAGVAGSTTGGTETLVLAPGEQTSVAGYRFGHEGVTVTPGDDHRLLTLALSVHREGERVATMHPEQAVFEDRGLVLAETALRSTPVDDVLVAIRRLGDDSTTVLEISVRPLAVWVWWGDLLVAAGGALTLIGRPISRPVPLLAPGDPGNRRSAGTRRMVRGEEATGLPACARGGGPPWPEEPRAKAPAPTGPAAAVEAALLIPTPPVPSAPGRDERGGTGGDGEAGRLPSPRSGAWWQWRPTGPGD